LLAVTGQGASMHGQADHRRILQGRHENETIHDENGMRHYYEEWGRWVNRSPSNPDKPFEEMPQTKAAVA
ncbi:MAG: methanesulfonate monooxygenase large subunit, partial [Parasphingorhabdus sp.]